MKKLRLVILSLSISRMLVCQNVGINTTGLAPNVSAMLDVQSTSKGLLVPRIALLSNTDAATIGTPATSLLIYNTATAGVVPNNIVPGYYYNSGTTASPIWQRLLNAVNTTSNAWLINGNSGTVSGTHFIGTTDNVPFNIRVNNIHAGRITSTGPVFLGYQCGIVNTGLFNTGVGFQAFFTNTSGNGNTAIGHSSLYSNTTGISNTAVGRQSLYFNTTGMNNVAIGSSSLYSNTTGDYNVAQGLQALYSNTTGNNNTGIGSTALHSNTTGNDNTAVGYVSLNQNTTGYNNSAMGSNALIENTTGNDNTANGYYALRSNTTGSYCAANGSQALYSNTTGNNNTANGYYALYTNTSGSNNTALGFQANSSVGNLTNATAIGNSSTVNASNKVRLGNAAVTVIEGQVAYTFPSDARFKENVQEDIPGLDFILKLRPVSYNFNRLSFAKHIQENIFGRENELTELSKTRSVGFLAQDIEKVIKDLGFESFDAIHKPTNETDNYSLSYAHFVIPLVKAVQEQQSLITQQNSLINSLIKRLELLEKNAIHTNKE